MDIASLTDDALWDRMRSLAEDERSTLCDFVEHLAELDKRDLYIDHGFRSLFEYCVHYLNCSEAAAYRRIRGARAIRLHPSIKDPLRDGRLTLEGVMLLHPHLEEPDAATLVRRAYGLKVWQIQELIAGRRPEAPRRDVIRICAPLEQAVDVSPPDTEPLLALAAATPSVATQNPKTGDAEATTAPVATPPRAPSRPPHSVRVAFTADAEFHKLMLRAKALLRHKYPDGRLEGVLKDALVALLKRKDRGFGWTQPGPGT